jgi:hypothetical protein
MVRKRLQASTKQNVQVPRTSTFDPLPLLSIGPVTNDDDDTAMIICAYFNHVLRAIGMKPKYEADHVLPLPNNLI